MKKLLLVFIFSFFLISPAAAQQQLVAPAGFPDVNSDNEFYEAIKYVSDNKIVNGYSDGTFKPDKEVSRGELTKIVIGSIYTPTIIEKCAKDNYFKEEIDDLGNFFNDIFPDVWGGYDGIEPNDPSGRYNITDEGFVYQVKHVFFNHVCMAKKDNIISGFSDGSYKPDEPIEFQASAKILANSFSMDPDLSLVSEEDKLKPFIIRLGENKIIPLSIQTREQKVTRAELAEMIFRIKTDPNKESRIFEDFQTVTVQE